MKNTIYNLQRLLFMAYFLCFCSVVASAVSTTFTTTSTLVERNSSMYYNAVAPSLFANPTVQGGLGDELTAGYESDLFYSVSSGSESFYNASSGTTSSYNASSGGSSSPRRVGTVRSVTEPLSGPGTPGPWPGTPGGENKKDEGDPIWLPIGNGLFPLLLLALLSIGIVTIRKRKSA